MTKAIRSPIAKVIMFIAGYIAAFSVARDVSRAFNYYAEHSLGGWMKMGIAVSFFCLLYAWDCFARRFGYRKTAVFCGYGVNSTFLCWSFSRWELFSYARIIC